jgi:flagellar motor switch/type III secretory pathway protein FliN
MAALSSSTAPPGARALQWCSDAQRRVRQDQLSSAVAEWGAGWGLRDSQVELSHAWASDPAPVAAWQPMASTADGQTVLWWSITGATSLQQVFFGEGRPGAEGAPADAPMAESLVTSALGDLRAGLTAALGAVPEAGSGSVSPPLADLRPWSGAMRARLTLGAGPQAATVLLHAGAAAWPVPSRRVAPAPMGSLAPVVSTLAHRTLTLQVLMTDLQLRLAELRSLRVGDVVITEHSLAAPLLVVQPGRQDSPLYAGHLAQRSGRVAVSLVSAAALQHSPVSPMSNSSTPSDNTAQWLSLPEASDPNASAPRLGAARNPLLEVKARLQVCVGEAVMTVGELSQAQQGQVVVLDR